MGGKEVLDELKRNQNWNRIIIVDWTRNSQVALVVNMHNWFTSKTLIVNFQIIRVIVRVSYLQKSEWEGTAP